MTTYPALENELLPSVARTLLSLRRSLKQHAAVYRGEPFILALMVPEEIQNVYARAFDRLRREEPEVADVELGTSAIGVRRVADYKHIKAMLRLSERVLRRSTPASQN